MARSGAAKAPFLGVAVNDEASAFDVSVSDKGVAAPLPHSPGLFSLHFL